jgi:hypothetical protein
MEVCSKCNHQVKPHDYAVGKRPVGSPGLHVRRFLCVCGCKSVQFYTVMDVSKMRSSHPVPGAVSLIPAVNYPIFKDGLYVNR